MGDRPSRREVLTRLGAAGLVLGGPPRSGGCGGITAGIDVHRAEGARQVRDFRLKAGPGAELPELVVAKNDQRSRRPDSSRGRRARRA